MFREFGGIGRNEWWCPQEVRCSLTLSKGMQKKVSSQPPLFYHNLYIHIIFFPLSLPPSSPLPSFYLSCGNKVSSLAIFFAICRYLNTTSEKKQESWFIHTGYLFLHTFPCDKYVGHKSSASWTCIFEAWGIQTPWQEARREFIVSLHCQCFI